MARLRIISGVFGGRWISADVGRATHPMGDRVRSAMFSMLESRGVLADAEILDAFAGTGAIGLEAISRGAKSATFREKDRRAANIIDENITTLGVTSQAKVIRTGVSSWTETNTDGKYDIIFVDPPYHDMQFSTVSRLFYHLKKNGVMVLSHIGSSEVLKPESNIVVVDNRSYGDAALAFYRLDA